MSCLPSHKSAVYNLVEGEDVEATEAKLAAYQRQNADSIVQNEAHKVGGSQSHPGPTSRASAM